MKSNCQYVMDRAKYFWHFYNSVTAVCIKFTIVLHMHNCKLTFLSLFSLSILCLDHEFYAGGGNTVVEILRPEVKNS